MSAPCVARRQALLLSLPAGSVALIPAASQQLRNGDVHYPFRQSSDFYYLTDFDEPDALLLLRPGAGAGEQVLFCAPRNPLKERWDGPITGPKRAQEQLGIATCLSLTQLEARLGQLLTGASWLYCSETTPAAAQTVDRLLAQAGCGSLPERRNLDELLHEMRLLKDDEELARMRTAAAITTRAHRRMMRSTRTGRCESDLEAECLAEFRRGGAAAPAYPSIVGAGDNACVLHYVRNDAPLCDGDLVLVDAGCEYRGYAADITRTWPVSGQFSAEQRAIYEVVLQAQQEVRSLLAPGVPYGAAQERAVRVITSGLMELGLLKGGSVDALIAEGAYRAFYMHRVGHWLGMDVHDVGSYQVRGKERELRAGMVMTVEPGIYVDRHADVPAAWRGIGVRIEDDVLITAGGAEVLGDAPEREPSAVEAAVGGQI